MMIWLNTSEDIINKIFGFIKTFVQYLEEKKTENKIR